MAAGGIVRLGVLDSERLVKDYDTLSPQLRALMRSLIQRLKESTSSVCNAVVENAERVHSLKLDQVLPDEPNKA